jgi:hypothetical protein
MGLVMCSAHTMLDQWVETLKSGECIKEHELKALCRMVRGDSVLAPRGVQAVGNGCLINVPDPR